MAPPQFQIYCAEVDPTRSTPNRIITLSGEYTDVIGSPSYNKALLETRAANLQACTKWYHHKYYVAPAPVELPIPYIRCTNTVFVPHNDNAHARPH